MKKSTYSVNKNGDLSFRSQKGETVTLQQGTNVFYIDLFCGAGGVSWGVTKGGGKVIYCINHDPLAIASHQANLPNILHATEDIRNFDLAELVQLVTIIRQWNPEAVICLWASLECTHFSKAKGGNHRDGDSRTLAEHLYRYIEQLDPDYIDIENVVEFMSWGPLRIACEKMHKDRCDLKLKKAGGFHMVPYSRKNGKYYSRWKETICQKYGYTYDHRILNSADFGALTSRTRYFGQFRKAHLPFTWPQPTHAKNPGQSGMFGELQPWRAVKPALDLADEGKSIFGRKKPLSENTLKRIYAGLVKYVGEGREPEFIMKYLSNSPKSGLSNPVDLNSVAPTITTQNRLAVVSSTFLTKYHSTGENHLSTEEPCSTLSTRDRLAKIQVVWLMNHSYGNTGSSTEAPAPTLLASRKHFYLLNPQYQNKGNDLYRPCFTLIARMDKMPPYLVDATEGAGAILIYEDDCETMQKIKLFMAAYGIMDIKMRMLKVPELLRIQGFGDGYRMLGTQTDQKRFIGNAVEVNLAMHKAQARISAVHSLTRKEAVA